MLTLLSFIGKQTRHRRSDYIEWNYNSELVAFAARLGEKFDDSKLREAFITADFVEAETKRQEELQIKVYGNTGCRVSGSELSKLVMRLSGHLEFIYQNAKNIVTV